MPSHETTRARAHIHVSRPVMSNDVELIKWMCFHLIFNSRLKCVRAICVRFLALFAIYGTKWIYFPRSLCHCYYHFDYYYYFAAFSLFSTSLSASMLPSLRIHLPFFIIWHYKQFFPSPFGSTFFNCFVHSSQFVLIYFACVCKTHSYKYMHSCMVCGRFYLMWARTDGLFVLLNMQTYTHRERELQRAFFIIFSFFAFCVVQCTSKIIKKPISCESVCVFSFASIIFLILPVSCTLASRCKYMFVSFVRTTSHKPKSRKDYRS